MAMDKIVIKPAPIVLVIPSITVEALSDRAWFVYTLIIIRPQGVENMVRAKITMLQATAFLIVNLGR